MAKKQNLNVEVQEQQEVGTKFFDKTNLQWYHKAGTDKVTFCNSIDDIVNGKGETFVFTGKHLSSKILTKNEKEIEHSKFFLFTLADGCFILANKWAEMK